jgi:cyclic pyranopterin phosphate synthase
MPEEIFGDKYRFLPQTQIMTFEEITRSARVMVGLGVNKLRITGGEPLLRRDLHILIAQLAQIDGVDDIAMTTNAYFLGKQAADLKAAGLGRVTISLDTLDNEAFRKMNGNKADVAQVLEGVATAQKVGLNPLKINAVVQKGVNDHTIVEMARFCKDNGIILRFIEYMDVGTRNGWRLDHVVSAKEIVERIDTAFPIEPIDPNYFGEVAERYRYKDGSGEVGVIASVTHPFCGTCTRMRLSAEGQLYTCLFAQKGVSLRDPMRAGASDDDLNTLIADIWRGRDDRYSEIRGAQTLIGMDDIGINTDESKRIEMYYIGG